MRCKDDMVVEKKCIDVILLQSRSFSRGFGFIECNKFLHETERS